MPTIHNFTEAVLVSVTGFFLLLPALLGAIILLVVGWLLSDLVARVVNGGSIAVGDLITVEEAEPLAS